MNVDDLTWEELFLLYEIKNAIGERYMEKDKKLKEAIKIIEEEGFIVNDPLTKERISDFMTGRKDNLIRFLSSKSDKYGNPHLLGVLERYNVNSIMALKIEQIEEYIKDNHLTD